MQEFDSFGAFGRHLAKTAAMGEVVTALAAKEGAKLIADDAKAKIGEYQDGVGPFTAWANLADSTVNDRLSKGFSPDEPLLRTGELRDSIEVVSNGSEAGAVSADLVALYQEQGTATIPPRPFLGSAGYQSKKNIEHALGFMLMRWIGGFKLGQLALSKVAKDGSQHN